MAVTAVVVGLALPTYTCPHGYGLDTYRGESGPTCSISDVGYRPRSWWPTKIAVAAGGVVAGLAIMLWRRRRLVAIGLIVAFVALAVVWFIPDGYEQTVRDGQPVCCGREIGREWLRTGVVAIGAGVGVSLALLGLLRKRRARGTPALAARSV